MKTESAAFNQILLSGFQFKFMPLDTFHKQLSIKFFTDETQLVVKEKEENEFSGTVLRMEIFGIVTNRMWRSTL